MPTSIHVPKALLDALDRRAKSLNVSRNHLIVKAIEREVESTAQWSKGFFDELRAIEPDVRAEASKLLRDVLSRRTSKKKAPRL